MRASGLFARESRGVRHGVLQRGHGLQFFGAVCDRTMLRWSLLRGTERRRMRRGRVLPSGIRMRTRRQHLRRRRGLRPGDICATGVTDCSTGSAVCRTVGPASAGKPCRPAVDACDAPETCDGASMVCPPDELAPTGTPCDDGFCNGLGTCGACTEGEPCATENFCEMGTVSCATGVPVCTGSGVLPDGVLCRPSAGLCDVEEVCDGVNPECPADVFLPSGAVCRATAEACDDAEMRRKRELSG